MTVSSLVRVRSVLERDALSLRARQEATGTSKLLLSTPCKHLVGICTVGDDNKPESTSPDVTKM